MEWAIASLNDYMHAKRSRLLARVFQVRVLACSTPAVGRRGNVSQTPTQDRLCFWLLIRAESVPFRLMIDGEYCLTSEAEEKMKEGYRKRRHDVYSLKMTG